MLALIRGAGDLATGIALRLWRSGIRVVLTDLERPTAIRRTVAFSEAIVYGETTVEDVTARLAANADEARALLAQGIVPVLADPGCACREALAPDALVDAILAKRADPRFRLAGSVLAASSFAVFFGGSLWDGLLAGVIAVLVFWMERCLAPFCMNGVEFQFIASFCCGISTLLFCRIGPQLHADKILIGIIMLLIPGIMLTNSIRDILLGDIISGSLRLVEAILMAAVLALGMMAAIWLMGGIA